METAGRGKKKPPLNKQKASEHFIAAMPGELAGYSKTRGRLLYRASEEDHGHTTKVLLHALETSITQFSQRAAARKVYVNN
jgi:hypothetical protein